MNAGILPLLMICAAMGFALYATSMQQAWSALAIMAVVALTVSVVAKPPMGWGKPLFLALWVTTAVLAGMVHVPGGLRGAAVLVVALVAGIGLGLAATLVGGVRDVLIALPAVLLFLPSAWARKQGYGIAIKVMSSWIIAISLLAAMVSLTPTPGYQQDHME